jgi:alkyldihydroxyacetonephosphate synthase
VSDAVRRLAAELGPRVRTDDETRRAHRHDRWMQAELLDLAGKGAPPPLAVVLAESTADVATALRICRETRTPVVPFGGGSGVCGGVELSEAAIALSTRRLSGLVELDARTLVASFRAGTLGIDAERRVEQDGLTLGHWPQSVELSTVGGWVATRASGQYSTLYGNIEELVLALEVVLPDASVLRTRRTPRAAAGPDLRQLFLGSEGTLGVVTEVTFSAWPRPEASEGQAFTFARLPDGLEAIRRTLRAGFRPPVVRLYDAAEAKRFSAWCPEGRALLLLLHEGPRAVVSAARAAVVALVRECDGAESDAAAVAHWLEHRNRVPSFRELLERGLVVDTLEVAATWDRVVPLYDAVTSALRAVPGVLTASAHSSHSYRSGTNLYFTFVARPGDHDAMAACYRECWRRAMAASVASGAGIAHHHGIGRVRRDVLEREIGATGLGVLRALKRALDPDGLLNPGVLLPDEPGAPRR